MKMAITKQDVSEIVKHENQETDDDIRALKARIAQNEAQAINKQDVVSLVSHALQNLQD